MLDIDEECRDKVVGGTSAKGIKAGVVSCVVLVCIGQGIGRGLSAVRERKPIRIKSEEWPRFSWIRIKIKHPN